MNKCARDKYCLGMQEVMTTANRKGINPMVVFNIKTGKDRVVGVRFKEKESASGMMFNYCPFCGVGLRFWEDVEPVMTVGRRARGPEGEEK